MCFSSKTTSHRVGSLAGHALMDPATPSALRTIAGSALAQVERQRPRAEALCRDLSHEEVRQLLGLLGKCTEESIVDLQSALEQQVARQHALRLSLQYAARFEAPTGLAALLRRGNP